MKGQLCVSVFERVALGCKYFYLAPECVGQHPYIVCSDQNLTVLPYNYILFCTT